MLSERFTAHEAIIVAEEATKILDKIDSIIEEAVLNGNTQAYIMIYDHNAIPNGGHTEVGKVFIQARSFFINHYIRRHFIIREDGGFLIIQCPKK